MMYLTSDLHLCHNRDFVYKARGFNSIEEMNETILKRWNETIKPNDDVYLLGDVMLNDDARGIEILKQLNGHKYLAIGNHDTNRRIELFQKEGIFKDIQYVYILKYQKRTYYLSHYPTIVDNYKDDKRICLHGHTHQTTNWCAGSRCMYHVGVDSHACYPVSIKQIHMELENFGNPREAAVE